MAQYAGDPRWITVKYPAQCAECDKTIRHGDRAFYYPAPRRSGRTPTMYCDGCGPKHSAQFDADAFDEAMYNAQAVDRGY